MTDKSGQELCYVLCSIAGLHSPVLFVNHYPSICSQSCKDLSYQLPSQVPFRSLQVLLLLATLWRLNPLVKLLGGGSPVKDLQLYSNTQSHRSGGSTICFPTKGAVRFASRGCTHTYHVTGFSFLKTQRIHIEAIYEKNIKMSSSEKVTKWLQK